MTEMKEDRRQKKQAKQKIKCKKYQQSNNPTYQQSNSVDLNSSKYLCSTPSPREEERAK